MLKIKKDLLEDMIAVYCFYREISVEQLEKMFKNQYGEDEYIKVE